MSQVIVGHIEPTTLAEVGEFLRQEWDAFDRERLYPCRAERVAVYPWPSPAMISRSLAFSPAICSVMPLMRS